MMSGISLAGERSSRLLTLALGAASALILLSALAACHKEEKAASQTVRPVRTVTVELQEGGEKVSLTGEIQPRYQADLGFRVNGKILERPVDVGTQVKKDDLLARLDPQQYRQDLEVAKAEVAVSGGRSDAEPGSRIPPARTSEERPHDPGGSMIKRSRPSRPRKPSSTRRGPSRSRPAKISAIPT